MSKPLIWIHEEALRVTHAVFKVAPEGTKAVFVWDENYLQMLNYSFKRLVFLYETLIELPIDIIRGETISVIKELSPSTLYIPSSNKPHIICMIERLRFITTVEPAKDEDFVQMAEKVDLKRFYGYWRQAEKTAFLKNAGM